MHERAVYAITNKGRLVLRGPAAWALSRHARDLLALCDPQVSVQQARQFLPPESLHAALFSLRELELIASPPLQAPGGPGRALRAGGLRPATRHREASSTPTS